MTAVALASPVTLADRLPTLETTLRRVTLADVRSVSLAEARAEWADVRATGCAVDGTWHTFRRHASPLLTAPDGQAKFAHTWERPVYGLFLAPDADSALVNTCPWSSPECRATCLHTSGRASFDPRIIAIRRLRTALAADAPAAFLRLVLDEYERACKRSKRAIAARCNGTSDVRWERVPAWVEHFDMLAERYGTLAYDYTKAPVRARRDLPSWYSLTWSADETWSHDRIRRHVGNGRNVTVVVSGLAKGADVETYCGLPAVDGDLSDYRPADDPGSVVLLRAKGDARDLVPGGFVKEYRR